MMRAALLAVFLCAPALAGEEDFALREGPGRTVVEGRCAMCHSLDYIALNGGILDRKGWEASVNKMVKVMGAPIPTAEIPAIVEYLEASYGKR